MKKENYPVYKLFLNGKDEPISYTGDSKNADKIKKFVMQESGRINVVFIVVLSQFSCITYRYINDLNYIFFGRKYCSDIKIT